MRLLCTVLSGSHNVENENGKCSDNDNDNNQGKQCPVLHAADIQEKEKEEAGIVIAILGLVVGNSNLEG